MAGLFGDVEARGAQGLGNVAPGADDPRRRNAGRDSGFAGSVGGPVSLMDILPHLQGLRGYDYSGPNIRSLSDLLPAMQQFQQFDQMGPTRRHLERQGGDFQLPPGLADVPDPLPGVDNRLALGGPNVAPGNVDTGLALGQAPGIPANAQGRAMPHTQGWRNVAPGYSAAAAAGFGTEAFENAIRGFGPGGRPSAIAGGADMSGAVKPGFAGGTVGAGGGVGTPVGGAGPTAVKAGGPAQTTPTAGVGVGKPGAPATAGGGPASPKQPSTKQIGGKKAGGTGGGGKKNGVAAKKSGPGGPAPSVQNVQPKEAQQQQTVVAKKGGTSPGPVPKPAPPAPKPVPNTNPVTAKKGSPNPTAGPGKTKPKTTTAAGVLKSK